MVIGAFLEINEQFVEDRIFDGDSRVRSAFETVLMAVSVGVGFHITPASNNFISFIYLMSGGLALVVLTLAVLKLSV
jgi:hypothetical protein